MSNEVLHHVYSCIRSYDKDLVVKVENDETSRAHDTSSGSGCHLCNLYGTNIKKR